MALASTTNWEFNASATANMLNGGGFNTGNANFPTDATATSATGNAPVISSATYNFVAGDVGSWIYIKAGTNWTPGFYKISSVAANAATVNATIGAAVQYNSTLNRWIPNTVAGCATTASPTGGTYGVDYSQNTAAIVNGVADFNAVGASSTLTSATAGFTPVMVGNIFHQTTTGTGAFGVVGWYEIVSYTNATTVVLDRTPNSGTASVNTTGYVGGALTMSGSINDSLWESLIGGNMVFMKNGTFTLGSAISVSSASSTATASIVVMGYNSIRGDNPAIGSSPIFALGSNAVLMPNYCLMFNINITGTPDPLFTPGGTGGSMMNFTCRNSSTSAGRRSLVGGATGYSRFINGEVVSQNGIAISTAGATCRFVGVNIHDSDTGCNILAAGETFDFCIFSGNKTVGVDCTASANSGHLISNCLFYGSEAKVGIGFRLGSSQPNCYFVNNIFYGLTTGITQTTTQNFSNEGAFNDFFNNTTDISLYNKSYTDIAVDPQFTGASQITGSTATTSGSVLTQSGGNFSTVTDNVTYVRVVSGTGVTTGIYLITSHTSTTLTVNNALGTSSGGDVVYVVNVGTNYGIGTNLKAAGYPGAFMMSSTTGYLDIGPAQRQEAGSSATTAYTFSS